MHRLKHACYSCALPAARDAGLSDIQIQIHGSRCFSSEQRCHSQQFLLTAVVLQKLKVIFNAFLLLFFPNLRYVCDFYVYI